MIFWWGERRCEDSKYTVLNLRTIVIKNYKIIDFWKKYTENVSLGKMCKALDTTKYVLP